MSLRFTAILLMLAVGGFIIGRSLGGIFDAVREISTHDTSGPSQRPAKEKTGFSLALENPALAEQFATRSNLADELLRGHQWFALEQFLAKWATIDVQAALAWAQALPAPYRIQARRQVIMTWLTTNPDDAFRWVKQFDPEFLSSDQFYEALAKSGRYDLGIEAINRLNHRSFALRFLVKAWAQADQAGALLYLNELARTNHRDWVAAATAFAPILAREDFGAAVEWVTSNARTPNSVRLLSQDIARSLIKEGHVESIQDWATLAEATPQGHGGCLALAEHYAVTDPVGAVGWLNKIDDGRTKNISSTALIGLTKSRPDLAAGIIEQEPIVTAREHRLGWLINQWARTDPTAAVDYAAQSPGLSDEARARILLKLNASGIHKKE